MSNIAVGAGAGATAVAAAIAQAVKASGAIVRLQPPDFLSILLKVDTPLVVVAEGGFLTTNYRYLTGYKGLVFFTKSTTPLQLPGKMELITAKKIWIPS